MSEGPAPDRPSGGGREPDEEPQDHDHAGPGDRVGDDEAADDATDRPAHTGRPPQRGVLVQRAAAMGIPPAPPPRRTGVFVDVESLREHVGGLLRSMLGGYEVDALGNMTFTAEGVRIFVTVGASPMGPHVGVFCILSVDVPLTEQLAGFLLSTNHRMAFGAFSYEPEQRAVWLRHSLLGATLDGPELRGAVISIATTAAKVTELLRDRFGGDAFAEQPEEVQKAVHPPEQEDDADPINAGGYL